MIALFQFRIFRQKYLFVHKTMLFFLLLHCLTLKKHFQFSDFPHYTTWEEIVTSINKALYCTSLLLNLFITVSYFLISVLQLIKNSICLHLFLNHFERLLLKGWRHRLMRTSFQTGQHIKYDDSSSLAKNCFKLQRPRSVRITIEHDKHFFPSL